MKYEEIRDSIKGSGRKIFWFDSKGNELVVDTSKSSSRKKLLKSKNYSFIEDNGFIIVNYKLI